LAKGPEQFFPVVAHFYNGGDTDTQRKQSIGDDGRVGVDDFTGNQFITSAENDRGFDHNHRQ
jgi:hypothetical protein